MRAWAVVLLSMLAMDGWLFAETVRVEVSRDTWVSSVGGERDGNNGGSSRLKTKGTQEFAIVDIDPGRLKGRVIKSATLHLHCASRDIQRRLTVSTLASNWVEGSGNGYQVQRGSASFNGAKQGEKAWAYAGSDITAVCNGLGNTIWRFADATSPDKDGWQSVAVEPAVVAARVAGISFGFVVFDDVGSEYERDGERFTYHLLPNRFLDSKDSNRRNAPYFTIELGKEDRQPPGAIEGIRSEPGMAPGEATVTWKTPADVGAGGTIGFLARWSEAESASWENATPLPQYLVPVAATPAAIVKMQLRDLPTRGTQITLLIRAVDRAGNVGAVTVARVGLATSHAPVPLPASPVKPFDPAGRRPSIGSVQIAVIDALDKVHPVTGKLIPAHSDSYLLANHVWSASTSTIRLYAARNEFVDFQVLLSGQTTGLTAQLAFDEKPASPRGQLFRFRHVNSKLGPMPDPLVPLDGPISIPAADEKIIDQKHATLLGEVYVPHDAAPGLHAGTLTIKSGDASQSIRIELHVWDFTLPDQLSFIPEMNCYGLGDDDIAYYRLAHLHRTCLNRLGYNWRGQVAEKAAPKWRNDDFDWDAYDRHFGPILDGSAFADLPRKSVPVESFYLPLNENWPIDINRHFKGGYWADNAFDPAYRKAFANACGKFAAHIEQKKWRDTFFEFYLNNKVYHKGNAWSRSSAPWIFDEPMNTQDFWALRFFGSAFHEGIAPFRKDAKLAFRCDISRPQWQRDILDGVLDVNVVGGDFRQYQRMVIDRKRRNSEIAINYGSSNAIESSNVQPAAWCLDTWLAGADGVLPWQTIGNENSWKAADELALFYPGKPAGFKGPIASVRLKAYRRGQQDVEYLTLLAMTSKADRSDIAEAVRRIVPLSAKVEQRSAEDAGFVGYGSVDPVSLWSLRLRIGTMLDAAKPPAPRKLVELRTPVRDVKSLSNIGYITSQ